MKASKFSLAVAVAAMLLCAVGAAWAEPTLDWFYGEFDAGGGLVFWDGSGYNEGMWYYYENFDWWNQWFYDDPLDLQRWKAIDVFVVVGPYEPGPYGVEIVVNWSTDGWEDEEGPPLPGLFADNPDFEAKLIA